MSEEAGKICPDCGYFMDFHGLGCCYESVEPLRAEIRELKAENEKQRIEIEFLKAQLSKYLNEPEIFPTSNTSENINSFDKHVKYPETLPIGYHK